MSFLVLTFYYFSCVRSSKKNSVSLPSLSNFPVLTTWPLNKKNAHCCKYLNKIKGCCIGCFEAKARYSTLMLRAYFRTRLLALSLNTNETKYKLLRNKSTRKDN